MSIPAKEGIVVAWYIHRLRKMEIMKLLREYNVKYDWEEPIDNLRAVLYSAIREKSIPRTALVQAYESRTGSESTS